MRWFGRAFVQWLFMWLFVSQVPWLLPADWQQHPLGRALVLGAGALLLLAVGRLVYRQARRRGRLATRARLVALSLALLAAAAPLPLFLPVSARTGFALWSGAVSLALLAAVALLGQETNSTERRT